MNYKQHYINLVETRRNRIKDSEIYYEKHHIIPLCMGGSDDDSNFVSFTAREHYVAHWLLWKMAVKSEIRDNIFKLGRAFQFMACCNGQNKRTITGKQFERIRIIASITAKLQVCSKETKKKLSKAAKGRKWNDAQYDKLVGLKRSDDTKEKMSKASKGKPKSEKAKENMRLAWEKRRLTPVSEKTKAKMREAAKTRPPISEETREKLVNVNRGRKFTDEQ